MRKNKSSRLSPQYAFAQIVTKDVAIPQTRVSEIIKGNRRITADTAVRLSAYFENSAKFWLGLQDDYDIENELLTKSKEINQISRLKPEEML